MEEIVLSSGDENEDEQIVPDQLQIKKEKIELLECTVRKLNVRIGTEIIDVDDNVGGINTTSVTIPRYVSCVNTLHYQLDEEFGKKKFHNKCKKKKSYFHFYHRKK